MFKLFATLLILTIGIDLSAQIGEEQKDLITNYSDINPAFSAIAGGSNIDFSFRSQWTEFTNNPYDIALKYQSLASEKKIGVAFELSDKSNGLIHTTSFSGSFAYHLEIDGGRDRSKWLSVGLNFTPAVLNFDKRSLYTITPDDPALQNNIENELMLNIGVGAVYYTNNFYLGVSIPRILENNIQGSTGKVIMTPETRSTYQFAIGATAPVSRQVDLIGELFMSYNEISGSEIIGELSMLISNSIKFGAQYRTSKMFTLNTSFSINDKTVVGYSYGINTLSDASTSASTHQLKLSYRFRSDDKRNSKLFFF